jgi:uncharacterized protein (TIGR02453 family)
VTTVIEQWSRVVPGSGCAICARGAERANFAPVPFAGFPPEALSFYAGLEQDNTRDYWHAHKDVYEDAVREPLEELLDELRPEFGTAKVFRPYRNLRFSKDKTPYKTAQAAVVYEDGAEAGRYVELNSAGLRVGGGMFHIPKEQLDPIRKAIADDKSGSELERIKQQLESDGLTYHPPELKTAPRGYPKDHPRIDLLRRKNHIATRTLDPGRDLHTAKAKEHIAEAWRALTPLLTWLDRHAQ